MKKYYGLDILRAAACIGIMAMHMAVNNSYAIGGFIYDRLIPSFTDYVFLFMAVSAFGMCCGYFEKVMSGKIDWTDFYKKRYGKILPFFVLLIVIDLAVSFSFSSLCEGLTEVTLLHGFIPQDLSVIGVGWFLGIVFIFYLIFPFFCVMLRNKRCAWFSFAVSLMLNFICGTYFGLDRWNFVYSLCFFTAGGLVFLYKDTIEKVKWYFYLPGTLISVFLYYYIGGSTLTRMLVTVFLLMSAVSADFGKNGIISFFSGISMEFYLSHMFIFRIAEKLGLNTGFGNGWLQYIITVVIVLAGTSVFSFGFRKITEKAALLIKHR